MLLFTTLWQKVCHVLTEIECLIYSEFVLRKAAEQKFVVPALKPTTSISGYSLNRLI